MNFGYNNRWIRLVKDLLFVGLGIWLITTGKILAVIIGVLGLYWYGRDAYFQAKTLWQEKHYRPASNTTAPRQEPKDEKITVSEDAKEVKYEKE